MQDADQKMIRLSELPAGRRATIRLHGEEGAAGLMLMEVGCVPGSTVQVEMIAPLGDPVAIRVAGYRLGIRKADAAQIWVTPQA